MIYRKTSKEVTLILSVTQCMSQNKRVVLVWSYFESQFNHGSLIWMFCGRCIIHSINRLYERASRIAYDYHLLDFKRLLNKNDTVTIHNRNLRA